MSSLPQEVRGLIHDQLQLAALEVRLASHSLMIMIFAAVCSGIMVVLVWLGLMAAIGLSLINAGLQPALVVLVVTALNSIIAFLLFGLIRIRSRDLGLPATMRALKPSPPEAQDQHDQGQHDQGRQSQARQNQDRAMREPGTA